MFAPQNDRRKDMDMFKQDVQAPSKYTAQTKPSIGCAYQGGAKNIGQVRLTADGSHFSTFILAFPVKNVLLSMPSLREVYKINKQWEMTSDYTHAHSRQLLSPNHQLRKHFPANH
jgi:hypothetical protein